MGTAATGRARLADTLAEVAPGAPTLCAGWDARALATHLVVRERRPDAALGIALAPLAGWTAHVSAGVARRPYGELVAAVRQGPPLSPTRLRPVDDLVNTVEFAVHREDARRGTGSWVAEPLDDRLDVALWNALRLQRRLLLRSAPVSLRLRTPDGRATGPRDAAVTLTGDPLELVLYCSGRQQASDVEAAGAPDDVAAAAAASLGL